MGSAEDQIRRLRDQIRVLFDELPDEPGYGIPRLMYSLDWGDEEFSAAREIFEKHEEELQKEGDLHGFEQSLTTRFRIGYQTVKEIVLAFYDSQICMNVCERYAEIHPVAEFRKINEGRQ